jgi:hypothetical protein
VEERGQNPLDSSRLRGLTGERHAAQAAHIAFGCHSGGATHHLAGHLQSTTRIPCQNRPRSHHAPALRPCTRTFRVSVKAFVGAATASQPLPTTPNPSTK